SITVDAQAEADYGSAAIKESFSRWIPAGAAGRSVADRVGTILLARFRDPPRHFRNKVLRGSLPSPIALARGYNVAAFPLQDETGAAALVPVQVTRLRPMADVIDFEAEEVLFNVPAEDLAVRSVLIASNEYNLNLRTAHDA